MGHQGRRKTSEKYAVTVKCPWCHVKFIEYREVRPIRMPRVYCRAHEYMRYDSNEGSDYTRTKKAGRKAAA